MHIVTRSFFTSIIKPFRWPFPLIYSLPRKCIEMLESPVPFICGVKMNDDTFNQKVLPALRSNQKNQILFVYIDTHHTDLHEINSADIVLPQLSNSWTILINEYSKYHGLKKSRCIEIDKLKVKSPKREILVFKYKTKADKKPTMNKSRPKDLSRSILYSRYMITQTTIDSSTI